MKACPKCDGCGQIANSHDGEPWTVWMNLPVRSAAAVVFGIVKPIPCPRCGGSGKLGVHCDTCTCNV